MVTSANSSTLRAQLFRIFEDRTYKPPPLPAVALEMASLASKADVNVGDVVRLLERDQTLAGAVMRLVGSPILAGRSGALVDGRGDAPAALWGLSNELSLIVANHHHEHTGNSVRIAVVVNIAESALRCSHRGPAASVRDCCEFDRGQQNVARIEGRRPRSHRRRCGADFA